MRQTKDLQCLHFHKALQEHTHTLIHGLNFAKSLGSHLRHQLPFVPMTIAPKTLKNFK